MAGPAPHTLPGYSLDGPWFYNAHSGALHHEAGLAAVPYDLATRAPGDWYGFRTEADVLAAVKAEGWPAPTGSIVTGLGNAAGGAVNAAGNAAGSALGLPTFTNTRGLAVRAIKVIGGLGILFMGLSIIGKGAGISVPKVIPV